MRQVVTRSLVTAAALGALSLAGVGTAAATPADPHRPTGIIDGSANDANVLDSSNILGAMLGSGISGESNNNANSRASGGR
jgi:hypothetical protein